MKINAKFDFLKNTIDYLLSTKMVFTVSQENQLHKDLLEYLVNNELPKTAHALAEEVGLDIDSVDPEGKKLEIKWKSILSLQKKITNL